ncbi:MAG TPA: hypothetical protein PLQ01_02790 [Methanothrix sp.]|jgi:hypothetical protein|nr:hypothetical protein [Methanothrix sp.]HOV81587.1 hypothetical protein [Methanothrix sp.]
MICENESAVTKKEPLLEADHPLEDTGFEFKPKTPLGRRLWSIRKRIVASGEPLLGWDEIEEEVATRRGDAD